MQLVRWRCVVLALLSVLGGGCDGGGDGPREDAGPGDAGTEDRDGSAPVECLAGSTIGRACATGDDCADGCFCNGLEVCTDGACAAGAPPCLDDDIACTEVECSEDGPACNVIERDEMCADDDACNGAETCEAGIGCRRGAETVCNDGDACTLDSCDAATGCVFAPRDLDGDGHLDGMCGGDDCDDDPRSGATVYTGAAEVCNDRRDNDCDGRRDYSDMDCRPTNDTCATAETITASGTYSGSTVGLATDLTLECGPTVGPDAVFRLTLTEPHDVRLSVSSRALGAASLAVRPFAACETGPSLECTQGLPPEILGTFHHSLPAGDHAIIVRTETAGLFELTVTILAPTPEPELDVCSAATREVSAGGTFTGVFRGIDDDYELGCHGGAPGSVDVAHRLVLTETRDVTITASSRSARTTFTYLSLLRDCGDVESTLSCTWDRTARLRRRALPAGTYYVLLESSEAEATDWTMDVAITAPEAPARGDACASAIDITGRLDSAPLDTLSFDYGTSCGGTPTAFTPYRDATFSFTLSALSDVTLATDTGMSGFHLVSVGTVCGDTTSDLTCSGGTGMFVQRIRNLPAGTYYVNVATTNATGVAAASTIIDPPTGLPAGDRCAGAADVSTGYGAIDTLIGYANDYAGCGAGGSPDRFYVLNLTARKRVVARAAHVAGETTAIDLTLRSGSCTSTTTVACAGGAAPMIDRVLEPGRYHLVVEMAPATATEYDLRVTVTDP